MLSTVALSAPESYQLGGYVVSFDLNSDVSHQVQTVEPVEGPVSTIYPLLIVTDNNTGASITVTEYKELQDSSLALNQEVSALRLALYRAINVTESQETTIDGVNGFVMSGMPLPGSNQPEMKYHHASYWLDSLDCSECGPVSVARVNVGISSTYSDEITSSLIGSVHVAQGELPSAASTAMPTGTGQVLPPA